MDKLTEKAWNVNQVQELFFPGRSTRWVRSEFCDGEHGPVFKDGGGWLISESAVRHWQAIHHVRKLTQAVRTSQITNLKQNQ